MDWHALNIVIRKCFRTRQNLRIRKSRGFVDKLNNYKLLTEEPPSRKSLLISNSSTHSSSVSPQSKRVGSNEDEHKLRIAILWNWRRVNGNKG